MDENFKTRFDTKEPDPEANLDHETRVRAVDKKCQWWGNFKLEGRGRYGKFAEDADKYTSKN